MTISLFHKLCAARMAQTGESRNTAHGELRQVLAGTSPIPEAATADQAFLEACFLEAIGHCSKDRWHPYMLPFAVTSVTPRPHDLIVRIAPEFLPDVIRGVMPIWSSDEEREPQDGIQIYGIPGLRAHFDRDRIVLGRPGFPGRISIPAFHSRWRKAVLVVADLCRYDNAGQLPWLTRPGEWHPQESEWVQTYAKNYSPDSWHYRNSRFASQLLRRLPGLCPLPRGYWYDLWFNRFGDNCEIQFEWAFGPTHNVILDKILDPVFGPGAEIALREGQTRADCYTGAEYAVKIACARQPATSIALRRAVWERQADHEDIGRTFGVKRQHYRDAVEKKHRYQLSGSR